MAGISIPWVPVASATAFMKAAGAPTQPISPTPFAPMALFRVGTSRGVQLHVGKVVRAWERVIHQRAGQQLSRALIVTDMLEPGLPDALRDAAMELTVDDRRIDALPDVAHAHDSLELDGAGVGIDIDLARAGSIGNGGDAALEVGARAAIPGGIRVPGKRCAKLQKSDPDIGAGHIESAGSESDVLDRHLQRIGGMWAKLVHETVRGAQHGGTRALQGCRSAGRRPPRRKNIGIALNELDRLGRHAEMPGKEQGKRRLVALPDRLLTDVRNNAPLRIHLHGGGLTRTCPGGMQV